jgi:hypothetical protein
VDWKLEVVVVPVSDVDRAKRFYSEQVGFVVDVDRQVGDAFRVVQMTPPGSACSVTIGTGVAAMPPGSLKGLQLVVTDLEAAGPSCSSEASTSARSGTSRTAPGSTGRAKPGTHSSSSTIRTATAGPSS